MVLSGAASLSQPASSQLLTVLAAAIVVGTLAAPAARAQRASTAEALERMQEGLAADMESGALANMSPILLVGARPAFQETRAWFPTAATVALANAVGRANLRACEACLQPRVYSVDGVLEYNTGALGLEEINALDANTRGAGAPARAAAWIDETDAGVAVRIISLSTGAVLFARNFDENLRELSRSAEVFSFTDNVERRLRGESLTHIFFDAALYPGQHFSLDVIDQFGDRNLDMAGITMSAWDPLMGIGAVYYRVIPEAFNLTVGVQGILSLPTAATTALGFDGELVDPLLTGVLVLRWPIPTTSYAVLATASTNGQVGIGVTLMNFSLLPVLP